MSSKSELHEIIAQVKDLAIELERTPTREEIIERTKMGRGQLERRFGTFTQLVTACGLDPKDKSKIKKLNANEVLYSKLPDNRKELDLKNFVVKNKENKMIVVAGDTHFPFVNFKVLDKFYEFIEENKKKVGFVVQVGDLYDMYAASKFPKSQNFYKPQEEMDLGRKQATEFWKTICKIVPKSNNFQLLGNHDARSYLRVMESVPFLEGAMREHFNKIFEFENVTTIQDTRQELIIGETMFHHGYRSQLGQHRDYTLQNFCCGHSHTGGVVYKKLHNKIICELNAGYMGDSQSKVFGYTPQKTSTSTEGWACIDEYGHRFIPYKK